MTRLFARKDRRNKRETVIEVSDADTESRQHAPQRQVTMIASMNSASHRDKSDREKWQVLSQATATAGDRDSRLSKRQPTATESKAHLQLIASLEARYALSSYFLL